MTGPRDDVAYPASSQTAGVIGAGDADGPVNPPEDEDGDPWEERVPLEA